MAGRGFSVKIELDLHAITCPGVWLCPNGKIALQLNMFNNCIESHQITPIFPLLFHNKFTFKKVFTGVTTLADLQRSLEEEFFYAELIQWSKPNSRGVILATFETNLVDLLYPAPCFKGLLAGVDVDLLMEPTKYFPGILAPKIEISTRTVIEEVIGICDSTATGAHVVNPKMINSKNAPCFCRKPPSKGIIRQRKVCHSQGRHRSQICRNCSQKTSSLEIERVYSPSASNRRSHSQSDRCYHGIKKVPKCSCPSSSPHRNTEIDAIHNDSHVFESCAVCSKYKCYFACNCEGKGAGYACKCRGHSPKIHGAKNDSDYVGHSSLQKTYSSCLCRPSSAPSPREDPSTLLLKAKIKQLQKAKAKLSHICNNREDDTSELDQSCDHNYDRTSGRQGFYKNLEKFYKRMYKQARMRAEEVDQV
ncbi:spermatogenesis-associated protein 6 isoform X2 [Diprion similis]|uniref:spermatogenesis-associated protein 6 isoform X2 n=1 Tax=Diprion similis TaxID=362088 RepID=UPI001EF8AB4C|nr:spermatogenesis-associated protein 6 isoform X2 [Diprion similis]